MSDLMVAQIRRKRKVMRANHAPDFLSPQSAFHRERVGRPRSTSAQRHTPPPRSIAQLPWKYNARTIT
eukprot:124846-Prymnesium_polylepis.1